LAVRGDCRRKKCKIATAVDVLLVAGHLRLIAGKGDKKFMDNLTQYCVIFLKVLKNNKIVCCVLCKQSSERCILA
jgi:hypothetical protein